MRELKLELRNQLTDLQYIQQSVKVHQNQIDNISILTHAYQNQLEKGYISKAENTRLKAQELQINKEILSLPFNQTKFRKNLNFYFV
ncbi:hypothetical protein [Vaginella massiliensis]|uniref:hypothetical protein n=1 Tax=Vaginella massiliensis TaxID=1816680 RepID=UPI000838495E|nr:hypothetical protein [Vaginella massiliensis]